MATWADFVRAHTRICAAPLVPEIRLHLAADAFEIWEQTEHVAGQRNVAPPYWAFAWAGGQALARYLLDHREVAAGRRVLDVGAGGGVVAIAAALAGAATVTAADTDPLAATAVALNARVNDVALDVTWEDVLGADAGDAELVLVGDLCYEREVADQVVAFCDRVRARGARVLVGDPGRTYFPRARFRELTGYQVPVPPALEDADTKRAAVWSPAG